MNRSPLLAAICMALYTMQSDAQLLERWQPELGQPASAATVAAQNMTVFADGRGLPAGSGTIAEGQALYANLCSVCHGARGEGALAEELAGGEGTLMDRYPDKTIALYWPYATTLFDVIKRAMPLQAPGSLTDSQSYALTAYLLHLNGLFDGTQALDRAVLLSIEMPNRDGFDQIYQRRDSR